MTFEQFIELAIAVGKTDKENAILTVDTETNAKDIRDGRGYCIGISMAVKVDEAYFGIYIPIKHKTEIEGLATAEQLAKLKAVIEHWPGYLVFHNAKFDLESLRTAGINYTGKFYCTMIMCHLINENFPFAKDLTSCVKHYVSKDESKKDDPAFTYLTEYYGWDGVPIPIMYEYAVHDAYITAKLFFAILDKFKAEVPDEYWEHKQRFTRVVIAMEPRGVNLDQGMSREMARIGEEMMEDIMVELNGFNPGSPKDLHYLLIEKLGMPVIKRSKKTQKPSFDKEAMEEYDRMLEGENDPTAKLVFAYRGYQKTTSSNYKAYLELVSPDGRLRPNYKLHGTKTGRMSCEKPNLQQIPRQSDKPWNGNLKQAFIPAPGYVLYEFDYSQLELRLGTAYAKEESLLDVFADPDRDIFTEMSKTLEMTRQDTKTFVYSTQYGAGLDRLSHVFRVSRDKADDMRRGYYNAYPGFVKVSRRASQLCKMSGKVQLWTKRYRHFWDRKEDAHKAFNSVIQGGAADIVEHVMVRLYNEIDCDDVRMLLQVHDSVVFEIREDLVEVYVPKIKALMEDVQPNFGVTFKVEASRWGSK
ncbi:MAG TPA: DNA polymerase [Chitinophagaceae bacterium]